MPPVGLKITSNLWDILRRLREYQAISGVDLDQDEIKRDTGQTNSEQASRTFLDRLLNRHGKTPAPTSKPTPPLRRKRYYWIDAICIDQSSSIDKNSQVPNMGLIFSRAQRVLICISTHHALSTLASTHHSDFRDPPGPASSLAHAEMQTLLSSIAQHPYWRRLWVVQEILLAPEAFLLEDAKLLSFATLFNLWSTSPAGIPDPNRGLHACLREMKRGFWHSTSSAIQRMSIAELLALLHGQECKDPHDLVYARFSLMPQAEQDGIGVGYHRSEEEPFPGHVAVFAIGREWRHVEVLAHRDRTRATPVCQARVWARSRDAPGSVSKG
ncbi:hypothetical protein LTR86_000846 [Recurvomyces mirabilis]|nr:hypothetical protein LTR86_000846 [Recurvomyces mirabilis]